MKLKEGGMGDVLKALRIARDMSVTELAKQMKVAPTYICDVEAKRRRPSFDTLEKYAESLGVSLQTLTYFYEQGKENKFNHQQLLLNILQELIKNSKEAI